MFALETVFLVTSDPMFGSPVSQPAEKVSICTFCTMVVLAESEIVVVTPDADVDQ